MALTGRDESMDGGCVRQRLYPARTGLAVLGTTTTRPTLGESIPMGDAALMIRRSVHMAPAAASLS
jgi:hypothetical protein